MAVTFDTGLNHRLLTRAVTVLALAAAIGLAVFVGVEVALGAPKSTIEAALGAAGGLALIVLAYARFEAFLVAALALRTLVDYTKAGAIAGRKAPPSPGHASTALALVFLAAASLWLLARYRSGLPLPNSRLVRALVLFVGACALSVPLSARPLTSLVELGRIVAAAAMLCVLEVALTDMRRVRMVLGACFAATILPLAFVVLQAATGHGTFLAGGYNRVRGTFVQPNVLGFFLAMFLIMGAALYRHLSSRYRLLLAIGLFGGTVGLLLTFSRSNWIAAIIGVALVGILQSRRLLLMLIIGGLIVLAAVPSVVSRVTNLQKGQQVSGTPGNSLAWRFDYWKQSAALGEKNILTGIGLKMTSYSTQQAKPPHNDILRAFVETGLLGLFAYVGLLIALARRVLARPPSSATWILAVDRGRVCGVRRGLHC